MRAQQTLFEAARRVVAADAGDLDVAVAEALQAVRVLVGGNGAHFVIDELVYHGHPTSTTPHDATIKFSGHEPVHPEICIAEMFASDLRWKSLVAVASPRVFTSADEMFPELRARLDAGSVESMLIVPFRIDARPVGYFSFFAKDERLQLAANDDGLLQAICDAVGHAIVLSAQRMARDAVVRRYESLLQISKECLFELSELGEITFVSPSWAEFAGETAVAPVGTMFVDHFAETPEEIRRALMGEHHAKVLSLITSSGSVRAVRLAAQPRETSEGAAVVYGSLRVRDEISGVAPHVELEMLTAGELEVVRLLLEGRRTTWIANHLFLSPHTVRNRLKRIFQKLGVSSQGELIELVRRTAP